MDREVKIFFGIMAISLIIITIIAVGIILKKRRVLIITGLFIITIEFTSVLFPCLLDFNDALEGKYETISGIALSNSKNSKVPWRTVRILESETGKQVILMFFSDDIDKGDYLSVKYLEHIKFGILVEKKDVRTD